MQELSRAIKAAAQKLFDSDVEPDISRPAEQFGDYATNVALQLAKKAAATPNQIADQLITELQELPGIAKIAKAGPGFINFTLTDEAMQKAAISAADLPKPLADQEILAEFGDPNPFKQMHIGHLYSYIVGDSISSLLEAAGATVRRLSYHGDVGRHVAIAIYGMRALTEATSDLGKAYAYGYQRFEADESAKAEIEQINQHIYAQDDPEINTLHHRGVELSLEQFDKILGLLSISTDKRYFESQSTPLGLMMVRDNIGRVFKQSQGAVVYEGEKAGLHTRVFITSNDLPTYETKDLGLVQLKNQDYPKASRSIVITANEQTEYFKVMLAALNEIEPDLAAKTTHLAHGFVSLSTGKMSSRTGDVYAAEDLIDQVQQAAAQQFPDSKINQLTSISALKYDFLKARLGGNIAFNVEESISLEGNSGPYLQYAHARACSILAKAEATPAPAPAAEKLEPGDRSLARKISEYPEVVAKATNELMPHHICIYLYELAQVFNQFYEKNRVIGDSQQALRLKLVEAYVNVLKSGLGILNIAAPDKM